MRQFIILTLVLITVMSKITCAQSNPQFLIFDGLMIKNKPDLTSKSFSRINIVYEDSITQYDKRYPRDSKKRILSPEKSNRSINRIMKNNFPVCLDVESWPLYVNDLDHNLKKYVEVMEKFSFSSKEREIGLFGVLPYGNVYKYDSRFDKIANASSIAYPVFYTKNENRDLWLKDVNKQLDIIKKRWPNLKVYAFIWPQYHTNNSKMKGKYISQDFWKFQLNELYKRCDGVVVWMPPFSMSDRKTIYWNSKAPWYTTTLNFIKEKKIKAN